jgi:hypothetical protein
MAAEFTPEENAAIDAHYAALGSYPPGTHPEPGQHEVPWGPARDQAPDYCGVALDEFAAAERARLEGAEPDAGPDAATWTAEPEPG